ncbi:MAG: NAD-dependent epimerase/dehydratase family protein [Salinivirgaceae bacterium]|nr:NAD-dependent epimerase/dehydratase family protein [Salinivirgaceae bacterium]
MTKISIIGSDSFIATQFHNSIENEENIKLFSRQSSGKQNEIVKDLFQITANNFIGAEVVINFAAIVHQPKLKDEAIYKKVNTELPIHLAKEAKKAGVKHFIQMSTVAVYGNVTSIDENMLENPVNIYGKSKLNADNALLAMQNENFKVSIIRPPMVYGGGNAPGNLMSLIRAAQKGIPMPFKGVNNARDFIHVSNLVQALNLVVANTITGVAIPTDNSPVSTEAIINFVKLHSSKRVRQIQIPKFAHVLVKKMLPSIYTKVFGDLRVQCNLPDTYQPKYGIEEGLKEMVATIEVI